MTSLLVARCSSDPRQYTSLLRGLVLALDLDARTHLTHLVLHPRAAHLQPFWGASPQLASQQLENQDFVSSVLTGILMPACVKMHMHFPVF